MTTYYTVKYDTEAGGPFIAEGANVTWNAGADVGFIVTLIDNGTTGFLKIAIVSGPQPPQTSDTLTQGGVTANVTEDATQMLYPAYFREDVSISALSVFAWTGPALGTTHSFFFDGQTVNVVAGEILTFSSGETCEVITVESDVGASGELSVRWISNLDVSMPADDATFTGDIAGDGTLNGVVHERAYSALEIHRLASDLNDDVTFAGNDILATYKPTPSGKDTSEIVNFLGTAVIDDTVASHMYGGSISQLGGDTIYSGLALQVTSPLSTTEPVIIQDDAIVTNYWKNAFMPDSVKGNIRIMRKTRADGVDIDRKRIKGKLLEFGENYFEGGTTLATGETALALFSSGDGNNNTAVGTVAGAPYNTVVLTEGFQQITYSSTAFDYDLKYGFGSANSLQAYERSKYIQRRGSAESINARNAQLFTGTNLNWAYDNELVSNYTEDEKLVWGTVITYSGQTVNLSLGEVVSFVGTGAKGRLIYMDDNGATGTLIFDMEPGITPLATDTLLGITSGGDGDVDVVTFSSVAGTAILIGLDDNGTAGFLYCQLVTGFQPADGQIVYGTTTNTTSDVDGVVASRTINNQFIGIYTGTNFQTNFGIGIDSADAILGDLNRDLTGTQRGVPDNQIGIIRLLVVGDYVTMYPWDGSTLDAVGDEEPDFDEMLLGVALTGGSTQVDVGAGNIPDNTPQLGDLRVERDSDNELDLLPYDSHDGDRFFELVGTPAAASAIGNTVMRAPVDKVATAVTESFTAVKGAGNTQYVVKVKRGGAAPIKVNKQTATFGAAGFDINASRISDL